MSAENRKEKVTAQNLCHLEPITRLMHPRRGTGKRLFIYVLKTQPTVIQCLQQPFEEDTNILSLKKILERENDYQRLFCLKFHVPPTICTLILLSGSFAGQLKDILLYLLSTELALTLRHTPQNRFSSFIKIRSEPRGFTGVGKIPWRREWLPTPVFLPGEFHGQRSLAGYSL